MQGRSLEYLHGADRLSQGAFTFLLWGKIRESMQREQQREKERPGRRQSQSPGGEGLMEWGQGQWGQERDRLQKKFLSGNTMSDNDEQREKQIDCKTGNDSLGSVSLPGACPHLTIPLQE